MYVGESWFTLDEGKIKKHLELVLNRDLCWNEKEPEENVEVIPVHCIDDVTASSLPENIPADIKDEMILNARRLIDQNLVRKAFNTDEYEVSRDHTSRALTMTFSKKGIVACKKSECLHYTMFKICSHCLAVAAITNTLNKLLKKDFKPVSLTETAKYGHPSGSGTKKGYRRKRKSSSTNPAEQAQKKKRKSKQYISGSSKVVLDELKSSNILNIPSQSPVLLGQSLGPKPAQPESQLQAYELICRTGQIKRCNGCEELFNKENERLLILGRNELDWYISVDGKTNTKIYKTNRRNFYYCLKRRCLLLRRPLLDTTTIEIQTSLLLSDSERVSIEEELGVTLPQ